MHEFLSRLRRLLPQPEDWQAVRRNPRRDLMAGVTVAIVALPLALAFGATSGLGAASGIATAIVAGAIAAIFGGSNLQVSGPTGAMTVVLVPVVHQFGVSGVLMVGLIAGLALIAMSFVGLGRYVRYLPMPVVEGFTAGIAVVIALQQFPAALGVPAGDDQRILKVAGQAVIDFAGSPEAGPPLIAVGVAAVMLIGGRWRPGVPFSLIGIVLASLLVPLLGLNVETLGTLPAGLPAPSLDFINPEAVSTLLPAVVAVAALAALESLLSATVADGMSVGERHDPDRELFGQGLANVAAPIFGGIPATAAIARTAVNVRSGAGSKLAAFTHAVVLLVIILAAASLVGKIPLAALAGVLLATTVRMVEVGSLRAIVRATRGDAAVLLLTFGVTVVFDLVAAVAVGLGVAMVIALRAVARSARLEQVPLDTGDHSAEERRLLEAHIVAYRFDGPLFFGAAHRFLLELAKVADVRVVILRMSRVSAIDATGARVLGDVITKLERRGIVVLLSRIPADHDEVLANLGIADHLRRNGMIFEATPQAIEFARRLVFADVAALAEPPDTGEWNAIR